MRRHPMMLLVLMLGVLAPVRAGAQPAAPPSAAARKAAIDIANKGQDLFDAGKYEEALVQFQKADAQFQAPTFTVMIARTYEKLGKLLDARRVYQQIVNEKLVHYAPQAFFEAQNEAKKDLDALLPRIPTVQVAVTGAPEKDVQLTIDGQLAKPGQPVEIDPGRHAIAATAPSRVSATRDLELAPGAKEQLTLELAPEPPPPAPPEPVAVPQPEPPPPPAPLPPPAPAEYRLSAGAFTMIGGGAIIGLSAILGTLSMDEVDKLKALCPDGRCYNDAADTYGSAQTLGVVSTVGFVVGGAVMATGAVLVIMNGFRQPMQTSLVVGPGFSGVKGRF